MLEIVELQDILSRGGHPKYVRSEGGREEKCAAPRNAPTRGQQVRKQGGERWITRKRRGEGDEVEDARLEEDAAKRRKDSREKIRYIRIADFAEFRRPEALAASR